MRSAKELKYYHYVFFINTERARGGRGKEPTGVTFSLFVIIYVLLVNSGGGGLAIHLDNPH
jgi:hypothetical protein